MKADTRHRCPVCRAPFRETSTCSRCGADLTRLMTLAAQSQVLRQQARQALTAGDVATGLAKAGLAQTTCATPQGRHLYLLALWWHGVGAMDQADGITGRAGSGGE